MNALEKELLEISIYLKERGIFPPFLQFSQCGQLYFANVSLEPLDKFPLMNSNSFTGMSTSKFKALSMALTEFVERKVCRGNPDLPWANEGVAACAITSHLDYETAYAIAKNNSFHEAFERYVWATWWDEISFSHKIIDYEQASFRGTHSDSLVNHIGNVLGPGKAVLVLPQVLDSNYVLIVSLYLLKNGMGLVSGGAAGKKDEIDKTLVKALGEMSRHANALYRARKPSGLAKPTHFYDERLLFFGSKQGMDVALDRLNKTGKEAITLPDLEYSQILRHQYEDKFILYYSRYKNQPDFLGGEVSRLCL